ncbi:MAG: gamma-glutamylcyclotransferase family protein [Methermicoccaceae archaeon]
MELFVYGTLKHERVLERMHIAPAFTTEGWVEGRLYRAGWFPILLPSSEGRVWGSVLALGSEQLALIDEYECGHTHPPLFLRRMLDVHTHEGKIRCWAYVGNLEHPFVRGVCTRENVIPNGVW